MGYFLTGVFALVCIALCGLWLWFCLHQFPPQTAAGFPLQPAPVDPLHTMVVRPSSVAPECWSSTHTHTHMGPVAQLVLVIGDMHIPHRASTLPAQFKKLLVRVRASACERQRHSVCVCVCVCLSQPYHTHTHTQPSVRLTRQVPGKIQHILCTGNLVSKDAFDYLKTLASDVHVVAGDFDEVAPPVGAYLLRVSNGSGVSAFRRRTPSKRWSASARSASASATVIKSCRGATGLRWSW
jgi:hypothetical protein